MKKRALKKMKPNVMGLLVMLAFAIPAQAVTTVSIPNTDAAIGTTVEIPINVDDATDINGFQFIVTFDPDILQITEIKKGSRTGTLDPETSSPLWSFISNLSVPGQISLIGLDTTVTGLTGGTGSLAILVFSVEGTVGQTDTLAITQCILNDNEAQTIPSTATGGTFTVLRYTGSLTVTISPANSIAAGAQWRVAGGQWQSSGTTIDLNPGDHVIEFMEITGWVAPASRTVRISSDQTLSETAVYIALGDLDNSQSLTISDATLTMRMAVQLPITLDAQTYTAPYTDNIIKRADINSDQNVNILDVIQIMRKAIGL